MSRFTFRSIGLSAIAICISAAAFAQSHPFIVFDAPGAVSTSAAKINSAGSIVGSYSDASGHGHSFLRTADGTFTEFDPPNLTGSSAEDINSRGQIVGISDNDHAYLRLANGTFHEIDPPGAVDAFARGINDFGTIVGQYSDANNVWHGFVLNASGTYTFFDAPDAGTVSGTGTFPTSINASGEIAGFYRDNSADGTYHGFVRDAVGNITEFDPPGILDGGGTTPVINDNGDMVGSYSDPGFVGGHGFLRRANGVITTIDRSASSVTTLDSINNNGVIVGSAFGSGPSQGFRRSAAGIFTNLVGPDPKGIAYPASLNNRQVVGRYQDSNGISHGFVQ